MTSSFPCIICRKHAELLSFTGSLISEAGGLKLTHFPVVPDEICTRGHLIIEPPRHIVDYSEMTPEEAAALGRLIQIGSHLIRSHLGAEHVYLFRINDKVEHLHFHLVPRYPQTPRDFWGPKIMSWPDRPRLNLQEVHLLSEQLKHLASQI